MILSRAAKAHYNTFHETKEYDCERCGKVFKYRIKVLSQKKMQCGNTRELNCKRHHHSHRQNKWNILYLRILPQVIKI